MSGSYYGPPRGGPPHHGGGRFDNRGGFGGHSGGGGGGRGPKLGGGFHGGGNPPQERRLVIRTNLYPVTVQNPDSVTTLTMNQYHVKVFPMKRVLLKDDKGEPLLDDNGRKKFEFDPILSKDLFKNRDGTYDETEGTSSELTRRILMQLQEEMRTKEDKHFVTEGTNVVYSSKPLFDVDSIAAEPPQKKTKTQSSYYGPSEGATVIEDEDNPSSTAEDNTSSTKKIDRNVRLKDDPDQIDRKRKWFRVQLGFIKSVEIAVDRNGRFSSPATENMQMVHCLNIASHNAMLLNLCTFEKKAQWYFPSNQHEQENLVSDFFQRADHNRQTFAARCQTWGTSPPMVGIQKSVHLIGENQLFLMANYCLKRSRQKCKLLVRDQRGAWKLAGESIPGPEQKLSDTLLDKVQEHIKKISMHVEYDKGEQFAEMLRKKNVPEDEIKKKRIFTKKFSGLYRPQKDDPQPVKILATARDHTFSMRGKDGKEAEVTVEEYYRLKGVVLMFPNMPIFRLGRFEWFPAEFIFQAFELNRDNRPNDHANDALEFSKAYPGVERVDKITNLHHTPGNELTDLKRASNTHKEILARFNLQVDTRPYTTEARVLIPPVIRMPSVNQGHLSELRSNNGSWNIAQNGFENPAELLSFVVVDFTNGRHLGILEDLFRRSQFHKMHLHPFSTEILRDLVVAAPTSTGRQPMYDPPLEMISNQVLKAIQISKVTFLFDNRRKFQSRKTFFKTYLKLEALDDQIHSVLIDPHAKGTGPDENSKHEGKVAIYFQNDYKWETHIVEFENKRVYARLQYCINGRFHDIFNVRQGGPQGEKCYEILENGVWNTNFDLRDHDIQFAYQIRLGQNDPIDAKPDQVKNEMPKYNIEVYDDILEVAVECPSIIFFLVPDKNKTLHEGIKNICRNQFHVQSQVVVVESFEKQRRRDMYLSGIALKINTKLANTFNESCAWKVCSPISTTSWIEEEHTLVLGFSMSSAQGGSSNRAVVAAAGMLDTKGLALQEDYGIQVKSQTFKKEILKNITKVMAKKYFERNKQWPQRVVVFRYGGQDGLFKDIIVQEITAVKEAFLELEYYEGCSECEQRGCSLCLPPTTLIVAQSQHGIFIVPDRVENTRSNNVPSGTCVDLALHGLSSLSLRENAAYGALEEKLAVNIPIARRNGLVFQTDVDTQSMIDQSKFDFQMIPHNGLLGTSKPVHYRCIWNENFIFKPREHGGASNNITQLTNEALKNVIFRMSFQYGTATKATRLIPVLHYPGRLGQIVLATGEHKNFNEAEENVNDGVTLASFHTWFEGGDKKPLSFHTHLTA